MFRKTFKLAYYRAENLQFLVDKVLQEVVYLYKKMISVTKNHNWSNLPSLSWESIKRKYA